MLYLQVLRALYGMLVAALLWYRMFRKDLEGQGFEFNPYGPYVCNRVIDGKQHTVMFHVDDLMSSHVDAKVNTEFLAWLNAVYGKHGEVKATRGMIHDYLGMTLDFSVKGKVIVSMKDYMRKLVMSSHTRSVVLTRPQLLTICYLKVPEKSLTRKGPRLFTPGLPKRCLLARGRGPTSIRQQRSCAQE